jgi:hypothetical protein
MIRQCTGVIFASFARQASNAQPGRLWLFHSWQPTGRET